MQTKTIQNMRKELKEYINDNDHQIGRLNIHTLKIVSIIAFILTLFFIFITPFFVWEWEISVYHIVLIVTMPIFALIAEIMGRENVEKRGLITAVIGGDCIQSIYGSVLGIVIYLIVMRLRLHEYQQKILYKCSQINASMRYVLEGEYAVSCSMGICYMESGRTVNEKLFHVADQALYEAKAIGKATYVKYKFAE